MFTFEENTAGGKLLVYTLHGAPKRAEELQQFLDVLERRYRRNEQIAYVLDLSDAGWVSADARQHLTGWLAAWRSEIRRVVVGSAVVVRSAPIRLLLSGLFLIQPPASQAYRAFNDVGAALGWAADRLREAGIEFNEAAVKRMLEEGDSNRTMRMIV